ncbi:MAG: hypothetical protein U1E76_05465 [Planctomycetota bacterium]
MRSMIRTCAVAFLALSLSPLHAQEPSQQPSAEAKLREEVAALKQAQEDLRLRLRELELQNRELILTVREARLEMQQLAQQWKSGGQQVDASKSAVKPTSAPADSTEARLELERDREAEAAEAADPVQQETDELVRQGIDAVNHRNDYANAVEILSRAIALDPFENQAFFYRGVAHHFLKHYIEAMADFTTAAEHSSAGPVRTTSLYNIACGHAVLGNSGHAFEYLEKAFSEGFRNFVQMREDPDLTSIRGDPRFEDLMQRCERADDGP